MIPPRPASAESMRTRPPAAAERDGTLHAMFRWFDNPFPADAEPQRLLALATTRRRLIEEGLGLTGDDADLAAFGPAAAFMAKLADATITPARRHLCALGLFLTGRHTEATDALLAGFADAPAPAASLSAIAIGGGPLDPRHSSHRHSHSNSHRSQRDSHRDSTSSDSTIELPERFDSKGRLLTQKENSSVEKIENFMKKVAQVLI